MSRRRGRPSQKDGPIITRLELLSLAAQMIGRDGFAKTSMRGIAREANVSLSTLQHHFRTKDLLWKAIIDEVMVPMEVRSHATTDTESFFIQVVKERLGEAVRHPGLNGRLLTNDSPESTQLLKHLVEATQKIRAQDRLLVTAAIQAERLRPINVEALMALLGVALPVLSSSKEAIRLLIGPDLDDEEQRTRLAEAIGDILLFGIIPREDA